MSKRIFIAIVLFIGTLVSCVEATQSFSKDTKSDDQTEVASREELKKAFLGIARFNLKPMGPGNEDLEKIALSNISLQIDRIVDSIDSINKFQADVEGYQLKVQKA